ncbi:MAG: helix-turn-helix domain-containing protein [Bacilli bacterium]
MELKDILLEARQKANLSQQEVADKLSYSVQVISKWENNLSSPPLDLMVKLANIYMIDLSSFLTGNIKSIDTIYKEKFDLDKFSVRFKTVRNNLKISLKDMGDTLERSKSFMIRLEKGNAMPTISFFISYIKTYKLDIYDTYFGHDLAKKEKMSKARKIGIISFAALFTVAISLSIARIVLELNDNGMSNLPTPPTPDDDDDPIEDVTSIIDFSKVDLPTNLKTINITSNDAKELRYEDISNLKSSVKTFADYMIYLKANDYYLNCPIATFVDDSTNLTWNFAKSYLNTFKFGKGNPDSYANLTKFLLSDNYDEVGFINVIYTKDYSDSCIYNYIKTNDKYYIFNISDIITNGYNEALNLLSFASLEDASSYLTSDNAYIFTIFTGSYKDGYALPYSYKDENRVTTLVPEGTDYKLLYHNTTGYLTYLEEAKLNLKLNRYGSPIIYQSIDNIKDDDIGYKEDLGNPTLTDDELKTLIYEQDIEVIKKKITNLCDLLYYLYARKVSYNSDFLEYSINDVRYAFNFDAKSLVISNETSSGELSNFARYVLSDNYTSVGHLLYVSSAKVTGNYLTSYLVKDNSYYFFNLNTWIQTFDSNQYIEGHYDTLKEYSDSKWYINSADTKELIAYEDEINDAVVSYNDIKNNAIYIDSNVNTSFVFLETNYILNKVSISDADLKHIAFLRTLY